MEIACSVFGQQAARRIFAATEYYVFHRGKIPLLCTL